MGLKYGFLGPYILFAYGKLRLLLIVSVFGSLLVFLNVIILKHRIVILGFQSILSNLSLPHSLYNNICWAI